MEQVQTQETQLHAGWCDSALPLFSAEVDRNLVFRGLAKELESKLEVDALVDLALAILLPGFRPAIASWYSDTGPALPDLLDPASRGSLDDWLAHDVQHWSSRWVALDPARGGSASSTKAAADSLGGEIMGRMLPPEIADTMARCQNVAVLAGQRVK